MMKTAVVRGFLSVVMLILLSGCAGLLPGTAGEKTEGEPKKAEEPQETEAEHEPAPVTVEEVESSLMQLTIQMNTVSDFQDYSNGDAGFEESLAILFLLDRRPDPEKQGALRAVYKETGEIYHEYARAVVDRKEDSRLWRFIHTVEGETLEFEVLVDDNKIPREVRYEDPYTEEEIQRSTRFDVLMKQAEDNSIRADIIRSLVRQK
ncbi:MAG: hypothetical protein R6V67_12530, partial [Spirochaetia bacterium]